MAAERHLVDSSRLWPAAPDFDQLLDDHASRVYAFVHRLVGGQAAEDVAQDVWLAVWRALPGYRGEARITTWLFSIAARLCHRHRRRLQRQPITDDDAAFDAVAAEGGEPEAQALSHELRQAVRRAIDALPDGQREVVHLRQLEGCAYAEIARILGIPVGTVRSRLHHGMARLAELLEPYLNDTAPAATLPVGDDR